MVSQKITLAAWSLLLSQIQECLNDHLTLVPITSNQQATMEMRDEVLSSVRTQDMDTNGYQVFNLEDIDLHWEDLDLNMDAVFQSGIETPFSRQISTIFTWV